MKEIDARGLSCPEPVLMVMNALKQGELPMHVWVSEPHQKDNVVKLAANKGLHTNIEVEGAEFLICIEK